MKVPLIGATWFDRSRPYWVRRIVLAAGACLGSVAAISLSVLFTEAIARSHTIPAEVIAGGYALTAILGALTGRRWLARTPSVRPSKDGDGIGGPVSVLLFLFMPFLAGLGAMIAPRLFSSRFPGERQAADLTAHLRQGGISAEPATTA